MPRKRMTIYILIGLVIISWEVYSTLVDNMPLGGLMIFMSGSWIIFSVPIAISWRFYSYLEKENDEEKFSLIDFAQGGHGLLISLAFIYALIVPKLYEIVSSPLTSDPPSVLIYFPFNLLFILTFLSIIQSIIYCKKRHLFLLYLIEIPIGIIVFFGGAILLGGEAF